MQHGLFDWQERFEQLDQGGDPLAKLNQVIPWDLFRQDLEQIRAKERRSNAGRRPFGVVLMFKILVLQSLYNLSDDQTEFQIRDRLSFMRFLGLNLGDTVPDAKTIWLFREQLTQADLTKTLFERFDRYLRDHGFAARKGQIVDASIVAAPRQRNSREENRQIKEGEVPDGWSENKQRQKDTDARWARKYGQSYYGYKNHIDIDVKHKMIRRYEVTPASTQDLQAFDKLLDEDNSSRDVWADANYRSKEKLAMLAGRHFRPHLQEKGCRYKKMTDQQRQSNRRRAKIRGRVEHVFGIQTQRAGTLLIRSVGLVRAVAKVGLRNLAYNLDRYRLLMRT
jgi:IS5 family transposase